MRYILLITLLLVGLMCGCMPGDNPVTQFPRGDVAFGTTAMGISYEKQIYYSLDENKILKENNVLDWDLGFPCADDRMEIILNFGKFMQVSDLGEADFDTVTANTAKNVAFESWVHDNPYGYLDSTAIGRWWDHTNGIPVSLKKVYLIDKGIDLLGRSLGTAKFQVVDYKDNTFYVRFSDLKKVNVIEMEIKRDTTYNYIHLSFNNGGKLNYFEPEKEKWDLLFTKYTELLYTSEGVPMWYGVVSVLMNNRFMQAATVKTDDFTNLTELILLDSAKVIKPYTNHRNAIGHEWKFFLLDDSKWVIYPNRKYLIKSTSGFTYKLHFTAFEDMGVKGNPKFEYQKL